jgi:hypothetical protein
LFWAQWKLGPAHQGKASDHATRVLPLLRKRKWIIADIKAPMGASKTANKAPFTDDELQDIITVCELVKQGRKNETGVGVWTGQDLKDLIWLMVYTGSRVSHATFFQIQRLHALYPASVFVQPVRLSTRRVSAQLPLRCQSGANRCPTPAATRRVAPRERRVSAGRPRIRRLRRRGDTDPTCAP